MKKINYMKRKLNEKVGEMRTEGFVPGVFYGPDTENKHIKLKKNEIDKMLFTDGEVYKFDMNSKTYFVKMQEVQRDPVTKDYLHVALTQLPKGIENHIDIPLEYLGTPVGNKDGGVLVVHEKTLDITTKPSEAPETIQVDVSDLNIGDKIFVKDIEEKMNVEINDEAEKIVASCDLNIPTASPTTHKETSLEEVALESQDDFKTVERDELAPNIS